MATPRSQQIGIWIIAIVMLAGTLGSFFMMIVSSQNNTTDAANLQKVYSEYQAKVAAQAKELSDKYYAEFSQYAKTPATFAADDVKTVATTDLKVGTGDTITAQSAYSAYYIGWNPKGVVFDQSIENDALKSPIPGGNLIEGWNEGVIGMKYGGIREITIPSAKAYGAQGQGDNIPPNTPLKFIVMVIPRPTDIPVPQAVLDAQQGVQQ
jgi:FKBP-type peptidyl-prolyl cis-trans isomerase